MTATSPNPPWVLKKKAVLVSTGDLEVSCFARLRIAHDKNANQGSISLRITADLANLNGRSQVLTLNVPPELVEECALARISNDGLCSPRLVSMLRASVTSVSAVSTLSLRLATTGIVLCPSGMESLSPADQGDLNFDAFAKICQSKSLRLHFSRRQFVNDELDRLETFSFALQKRSLQAESFDHARHGVVRRDWRAFSLLLDPPPYCEGPMSGQLEQVDPPLYCEESKSERVVGKRCRGTLLSHRLITYLDQWSMPPDDERRKRLLLPSPQLPGSPTEVNTPSTHPPSPPSIRPTHFTHASSPGRTERDILARLEHELRGVSDDLICKLLIRTGRQHLLAMPEAVDIGLPSESAKVSLAKVAPMERRLQRYVDEMIERRLQSRVVDEIVDSAVRECRDQIFDECKTIEADFREQVDDGNSEVRNTANECMKEMKEQVQKHMHEIEDQAQQCMNDIENQGIEVEISAEETVAKFKRWFNASSARSLLDSKSGPSHELGTDVRRSSV
ncbi:hypothetical protein BO70DRAFT_283673 [Aspergillus heteromorphus CBS 117.55]|uniref:Uncharacterized protein n=1 Tax=Aspergillus heteromorphus CBS 117.55 TaxID=1448321 RepID=A0A317WXG3_9EURO|nr:uncharacterized protein BO70DRAFT_283673 [Aspergillus heteromorphus CBS 117.55]PWY91084.1 hypothetical protein BO70DRAFT_283673 [Aspergillus heteromorphus CBS 117.55]